MTTINKFLEIYLHYFALAQLVHWVNWISLAERWYNSSYHTAIEMIPYEALYGQPSPTVTSYIQGNINVQVVDTILLNQEDIILILWENV